MSRNRSLTVAVVAAVIATAIAIVISFAIHWFPAQAATQAHNTDRLYHVLVIASIPIFVLVVTVVLYSVWQFRMKPGEELKDGPPIHGSTRLEVFWTAIPTVLLLGLVGYSFVVLHENEKKPAREIQVGVTGQQFAWTYEYPPSVTGGAPAAEHPALPARGRVGRVQHPLQGRDPRLLDPRLPHPGGRRARHHDALARHARPARQLPGRLQPAVRPRALADALDGPRRHRGPLPRLDREPDERGGPRPAAPRRRPRGVRDNVRHRDEPPPRDTLMAARIKAPGFYRAAVMMLMGVALATGLTWIVRMSTGHSTFHHFLSGEAILTVSLIAVPLGFLVGIGGFDYWFYWAAGRPTRPEDHSGHGAHTWKDYFRVNTDHKVIGVQYVVNSFFFLLIGGLIAMLMRAQLAQPGSQFVDANTFNGLFSVHASLLIFLFIIPVFAGFGNFVLPLMIGAPDMAFPRLNALSFWLLPIAGMMMLRQLLRPRRRLRRRLDRLRAAVDQRADRADLLHARACSSPAPRRS